MKIKFKLGRGVLSITFDLVKDIFRIFQGRNNISVYLIDEFKSSKIRFSGEKKTRRFSKDEISALILAFRNGIKVDQDDYEYKFEQIRNKSIKPDNFNMTKTDNREEYLLDLKEIIERVLNDEIPLSSAMKMSSNDKT
jgi:hypothetical protein